MQLEKIKKLEIRRGTVLIFGAPLSVASPSRLWEMESRARRLVFGEFNFERPLVGNFFR